MHDVIQQAAQAVSTGSPIGRGLIIFCGAALVYLLGLAWALVVVRQRAALTLATLGRVAALAALAFLAAKAFNHVIDDPRPFIMAHTQPLIPVEHEANGFPSDHGLLAAILMLSLWWIDRRVMGMFALGMALVMLGRLGIGAHHTVDELGSLGIVAVAALIVRAVPLPITWDRPLLPAVRRVSGDVARPIARRDPLA